MPAPTRRPQWQSDPLPRLPDSLLEHVISFLSIRDTLRCRLICHHYEAALPRVIRHLQIMLHHVKMVDWEAFINVQSLKITCEAQQLGSRAATPTAAASSTKSVPAAGTAAVESLGMIGGEEIGGGGKEGMATVDNTPTAPLKALLGGKGCRRWSSAAAGGGGGRPRPLAGLRELVLFGLSLGDDGMHDLWEGLSQYRYLTTLTLDGNDLTDAAMERLATVLDRGGGGAFTNLRLLQLSSNRIGDKGAARLLGAVAGAGLSLTALDLTDNKLGADGLEHLATALEAGAGSSLKELCLGYNGVTDAGLSRLSLALGAGHARRLTKLELESNHIGNNGLVSLAAAMAKGGVEGLVSINLCKNEIGDRGARELATALSKGCCPEMARLDLSGNCIASSGAVAFALALVSGCTGLRVLSLAWNNLADEGAAAFAAEVSRVSPSSSFSSSSSCQITPRKSRWLERLELSNNSIGDEGVRALAGALRSAAPLSRLESLDLTGNDFHDPGLKALAMVGRRTAADGACLPNVAVYNGLLLGDLMDHGEKAKPRSPKISPYKGGIGGVGLAGGHHHAGGGGAAAAMEDGVYGPHQSKRRGVFEAIAALVLILASTFGIGGGNAAAGGGGGGPRPPAQQSLHPTIAIPPGQ